MSKCPSTRGENVWESGHSFEFLFRPCVRNRGKVGKTYYGGGGSWNHFTALFGVIVLLSRLVLSKCRAQYMRGGARGREAMLSLALVAAVAGNCPQGTTEYGLGPPNLDDHIRGVDLESGHTTGPCETESCQKETTMCCNTIGNPAMLGDECAQDWPACTHATTQRPCCGTVTFMHSTKETPVCTSAECNMDGFTLCNEPAGDDPLSEALVAVIVLLSLIAVAAVAGALAVCRPDLLTCGVK